DTRVQVESGECPAKLRELWADHVGGDGHVLLPSVDCHVPSHVTYISVLAAYVKYRFRSFVGPYQSAPASRACRFAPIRVMRPKMNRQIPSKVIMEASPMTGMTYPGIDGGLKLWELMELKIELSNERTSIMPMAFPIRNSSSPLTMRRRARPRREAMNLRLLS